MTSRKRTSKGRPQTTSQPLRKGLGTVPSREDYAEILAQVPEHVFEDMAADTYVVVRRVDERTKQPVYLFRLSPDEAREDVIQQYAGGGRFYLRENLRDPKTGAWLQGRHRTLYIEGEPKVVSELPPSAVPPEARKKETETVPAVAADARSGRVSLDDALIMNIINMMKAQSDVGQMQLKAVEVAMARMLMPQSSIDWAEVLKVGAPILTALLTRDKTPELNVLEVIDKVTTLLKDKAGVSSVAQLKDQLEMLNTVMDLKDRAGETQQDPMMALTGQLPRILNIIESEQKRRGRLPTPEEVRKALPAAAAATPAEDVPMWKKVLHSQRKLLLSQAMQDNDAEVAADFAAQNLPAQFRGAIRWLLEQDNAMALILDAIPELAQYPTWTERFFTQLADHFTEDPDDTHTDDDVDPAAAERPAD